jgi:hypothetical protein
MDATSVTSDGFLYLNPYEGQSRVRLSHIVSMHVQGREDCCQIAIKDSNGDEYLSQYFQSFQSAIDSMNKLSREIGQESGYHES